MLRRTLPSLFSSKRSLSNMPYRLKNMTKAQVDALPQFVVGVENGFLPRADPLSVLPPQYEKLESLLQRMPIKMDNGEKGLLWFGKFGDAVKTELPDYSEQIRQVTDTALLTALFRDYTFAASAYLLEPCDIEFRKSKTYGLGRDVLPRNLAVPLSIVAQKIGAKPFMEYALSYALYNYARKDTTKALDYANLKLIRKFDGSDAEHGFILVHVAMVRFSGLMVEAASDVLAAAGKKDRTAFDTALRSLLNASQRVNQTMETMWSRSNSTGYNEFRTFIMGTKNQPMFPQGVLYEGVSDERTQYRGESGANDSMIPTLDNLLQVTENLPSNPLTEILKDFRSYRPGNHNEWLQFVETEARKNQIRQFALQNHDSSVLYLANLDMIREFRMRHWNFTKEYIMKFSKHPVATGGSPITTWLPNQLSAVMGIIENTCTSVDPHKLSSDELIAMYERIKATAHTQKRVLDREVEKLKAEYGQ